MSDDRRPAKVRVFSSGVPDANGPSGANAPNPGRRRTDPPQMAAGEALAAPDAGKRGGLLWVSLAVLLFLIGSALGGVLYAASVLFPGALL